VTEKKKITSRLTTIDDSDFLRDVAYWRRRGAQARFAESWKLSQEAYALAGQNATQPALLRSVVRIQRGKGPVPRRRGTRP
jgi:hypothetical protein